METTCYCHVRSEDGKKLRDGNQLYSSHHGMQTKRRYNIITTERNVQYGTKTLNAYLTRNHSRSQSL